MWLENHGHFTVPLWWLKKEGHTRQWTDHGTETFQEKTEITVLASQSEGLCSNPICNNFQLGKKKRKAKPPI